MLAQDRGQLRTVPFLLACAAALVTASPSSSFAAPQPGLTFTKHIAPIIWTRCAPCHRPGEIGPFSLITYADVKQRATLIATATSRRLMPPWKPVPGKGDFQDARRLTDRELQDLQQWIADGLPEGDAADLPPAPIWTEGWQLGTPDLIVRMPEPYTVRATGPDDFRTFVLPIPTSRPRFVRALEFHPGNARVVHHANLGIDRTRSSRQLDLKDPEPGYVGGMVPDARYPEGQMLGWTPGQAPHPSPPGMAWRLEPGSDLVAQLHLQPTGRPEPLQVSVGIFFTDEPPTRTPVGLRLGSETIDIPAGQREYVVSDSYVVPVDVEVVSVQPHAHNLARRMEATATRPDGTMRWLIAIDDWDFRWQDVYRYTMPFVLPKGTRLSMRYTYDNSSDNVRNPRRPPGRVVWGQNTTDEMGDLWVQVVPRAADTLPLLTQDFRRKARAEDLAAYTKLLDGELNNPLRHDAVAGLYLDDGQFDLAVTHFRRSLELNPVSPSTHYNLGYALSVRGKQEDAAAEFREALRLDPDYAQAHNNLGAVLQLLGKADEALDHYRRAVALRPDNIEARANLAQLLAAQGLASEAVAQFQEVLALRTDHPQALAGLAWIRATSGDERLRNSAEAVRLAERAAAVTGRRDLSVLDALAAAYASAGKYDDAVVAVRAGIDLAVAAGQPAVVVQFRQRLELYQQRQPYRVPPR
ncbi:MAG: tetratricopeptide repeat protein [Acidobacteria bacterium]|nr:tetratricopeptide repeat protein [Acidobacteriota bacterium]